MGTYTSPTTGGTVRASNLADIVNGSAANDSLLGLGGADIINAGAGDDIISGDGTYTVNDAIRLEGRAVVAYTGTVNTSSGLQLTSMGKSGDLSVWRIRNASDSDLVVVLESASKGQGSAVKLTITIPAHSDYLVTSPKSGTHKLYLDNKLIDTKAAGSQTFNNTSTYGTQVDGDDTINGGDGNDIINGNGGNDTLNGDAGNDTIDGGDGTDTINGGDGADILTGGRGDDKLFGGAGDDIFLAEWSITHDEYDGGDGIDTFKADGTEVQGYAQEIDLATGTNNWADKFVSIENLIGGTANDKFWGNEIDNSFWGKDGNDLLDGRAGADKLYGENGDDTLIGGTGADYLDGGAGNDSLSGGDDNDTMYGGAGNDTLDGGAGNDRLTGDAGADVINGGDGVDTADFRKSTVAVDVSLAAGAGKGGDAEGDTYINIENLSGSAYSDVLTGNDGANRITGMAGEDKIYGMGGNDYIATGGGYDYVDGGDGIDTVTYEDSWDRVVVNLTTGKNQYGEASRDVLINVENIVGSNFNDTITGDAGANRLTGGAGNDTLNGMAGIDYLFGGAGNDKMTGGTEADVFVFEAGFGDDTITDFWAGAGRTDRIWLKGVDVTSLADVDWSMADSAAGAVITIAGHGSLTLTGVTVSQLQADDFIFG